MAKLQRVIVIVCAATLAVACGSSPTARTQATPAPSVTVQLIFANWTPDQKAGTGPEPGYKLELTGLTSHDIQSATAAIDTTGSDGFQKSLGSGSAAYLRMGARLTKVMARPR